jgi:hypothetical protein
VPDRYQRRSISQRNSLEVSGSRFGSISEIVDLHWPMMQTRSEVVAPQVADDPCQLRTLLADINSSMKIQRKVYTILAAWIWSSKQECRPNLAHPLSQTRASLGMLRMAQF